MELKHANRLAKILIEFVAPGCHKIEVAGSIRRRSPRVKDIELIAEPRMVEPFAVYQPPPPDEQLQLFDLDGDVATKVERISAVNARIEHLVKTIPHMLKFEMRADGKKPARNGDRYKRLIFQGAAVDLFIVYPPAQWGPIMALRTGPGDFSRRLVTKRSQGGAMPDHLRQENGRVIDNHGRVLNTPTEDAYFQTLGVPCWKPVERSLDRLEAHLNKQARQAGLRPPHRSVRYY